MQDLNKNLVPKELQEMYPKGKLSIGLEDRREEIYTPPKFVLYGGKGISLQKQDSQGQVLKVKDR